MKTTFRGGRGGWDAYWGLHASECISDHGRKNVFLVVVIRGTSLWIWASRGPSATEHSLLVFQCLISVAAHTTCGRNVNFLILFGGTRPLSTRLMPNFQMPPDCRCHLCIEDIFFGKFCPKDKQTKAKKKTKKKNSNNINNNSKRKQKYILFVSI